MFMSSMRSLAVSLCHSSFSLSPMYRLLSSSSSSLPLRIPLTLSSPSLSLSPSSVYSLSPSPLFRSAFQSYSLYASRTSPVPLLPCPLLPSLSPSLSSFPHRLLSTTPSSSSSSASSPSLTKRGKKKFVSVVEGFPSSSFSSSSSIAKAKKQMRKRHIPASDKWTDKQLDLISFPRGTQVISVLGASLNRDVFQNLIDWENDAQLTPPSAQLIEALSRLGPRGEMPPSADNSRVSLVEMIARELEFITSLKFAEGQLGTLAHWFVAYNFYALAFNRPPFKFIPRDKLPLRVCGEETNATADFTVSDERWPLIIVVEGKKVMSDPTAMYAQLCSQMLAAAQARYPQIVDRGKSHDEALKMSPDKQVEIFGVGVSALRFSLFKALFPVSYLAAVSLMPFAEVATLPLPEGVPPPTVYRIIPTENRTKIESLERMAFDFQDPKGRIALLKCLDGIKRYLLAIMKK